MKAKKAEAAAVTDDGNVAGPTDGKAVASGMNGNGEQEPASLQLSDEAPAGAADPSDRGMPGVSVRSQQQYMPEGSMGHENSV